MRALTPEEQTQYKKDSVASLMSGRGGVLLTVEEWLAKHGESTVPGEFQPEPQSEQE